ncbi:hypothetical protein BX600DRAFT_515654 [Xylariales sp. PMI_506]|nr:hypothetical protein BX600DRAFT_515654 [Xylariales sp. PMI_506]
MSTGSQIPPRRPARNEEMPSSNQLWEIAGKSVQTGAVTGVMGSLFGYGTGIARSGPAGLFAVVAGIQWFALGSSYIASRDLLWHAWGGEENLRPIDRVQTNTIAGGVSGMVGGLVRGPSHILRNMIFFSLVGGTTTFVSQKFQDMKVGEKTGAIAAKWSPLKSLTEKEYEDILQEKILKLEAEIAIIDDNIAMLRASQNPEAHPKDSKTGR